MAGVELRLPDGKPATEAAMRVIKKMLQRGFILLPEGEHANVISFTPPLTITKAQLAKAVAALAEVLNTMNTDLDTDSTDFHGNRILIRVNPCNPWSNWCR